MLPGVVSELAISHLSSSSRPVGHGPCPGANGHGKGFSNVP